MPKSKKVKRSHYQSDIDYYDAMCRQYSHDTEKSFLNRCRRAEAYMIRKLHVAF